MSDIRQELIDKTMQELTVPDRPEARSRVWKSPNGYIYLAAWSNANLLRILAVKWIHRLKENKVNYRNVKDLAGIKEAAPINSFNIFGYKYIDRLEAQLLDCLRSTIANIEEGYARPTSSEYLTFLGYSQASLKEAKGDFQRSRQDGFLLSIPGSSLLKSGIDLRAWHESLKQSAISKPVTGNYGKLQEFKGEQVNAFNFNYPPVDKLDPATLTYEIIIELVNKTDWQLRRLVESLEAKLSSEQKAYQVEKARIRSRR